MLAVSIDIWVGAAVVAAALAANVGLVLWSRARIERIHRGSARTAREIQRHLNGD